MNYTKKEINNFNQKDKRITFLSIFSSLMLDPTSKESKNIDKMFDMAIKYTDKLYEKYPIIEEEEQKEGQKEGQKDEQPM